MCAGELRRLEQDLAAFDAKIKQQRRQAAFNLKPPVFARAPGSGICSGMVRQT
jgi:hypothetical protein